MNNISELLGKTLESINLIRDENYCHSDISDKDVVKIEFVTQTGEKYKLYHPQDYSEIVYVEDICGDLNDLIGEPILLAEEVAHEGEEELPPVEKVKLQLKRSVDPYYARESATWTFYKLGTRKGGVTIRWLGESNGYYSESVSFTQVQNND